MRQVLVSTVRKVRKEMNIETNPRSRSDSSCLPVSLRGSPVESTATASSSSKLGATNRSRRLVGLCCLRASVQQLSPPPAHRHNSLNSVVNIANDDERTTTP